MSRVIMLFESTHAAIKAERLCVTHHLKCRTIAVPRSISSDCGIGLEIDEELTKAVGNTLSKNGVSYTVQRLPKQRI